MNKEKIVPILIFFSFPPFQENEEKKNYRFFNGGSTLESETNEEIARLFHNLSFFVIIVGGESNTCCTVMHV